MEKQTRTCSFCNKVKTILRSGWYANDTCSACHARAKYSTSNRNETKKTWRIKNKKHHNEYMRNYKANKISTDIQFKIKNALRKRLTEAVKNDQKSGSAIDDLGCSIEEFKCHLESKFADGMSWDNYGKWHIDHIRALSLFDLTDKDQLKEACNYKNLQPLWAEDNIKKSNK